MHDRIHGLTSSRAACRWPDGHPGWTVPADAPRGLAACRTRPCRSGCTEPAPMSCPGRSSPTLCSLNAGADFEGVAMSLPQVVSRDEWLVARRALLAREKELTDRKSTRLNSSH